MTSTFEETSTASGRAGCEECLVYESELKKGGGGSAEPRLKEEYDFHLRAVHARSEADRLMEVKGKVEKLTPYLLGAGPVRVARDDQRDDEYNFVVVCVNPEGHPWLAIGTERIRDQKGILATIGLNQARLIAEALEEIRRASRSTIQTTLTQFVASSRIGSTKVGESIGN